MFVLTYHTLKPMNLCTIPLPNIPIPVVFEQYHYISVGLITLRTLLNGIIQSEAQFTVWILSGLASTPSNHHRKNYHFPP